MPQPARRPRPRRLLTALALAALALLGPALLVVGQLGVAADEALAASGDRVAGTVVEASDSQRASQRDVVVAYRGHDGVERTVVAKSDHEQVARAGDAVEVAVDPADPDRAVVLGFESGWAPVAGMGVVLSAIAVLIAATALVTRALRGRAAQQADAPADASSARR
ncbi:DUF3592 domain-containing protein [Agrococcus sediminis]|uniref:DUF3592 domain-containing protein n=1 Tax=Agrococcus sediminis TaxID=2599924 RepID=UPI003436838B